MGAKSKIIATINGVRVTRKMLQEAVKLQELRIELANKRGFTSPDIMEVFDEDVHRNYTTRPDYAELIESEEKGVEFDV